MNGIGLDCGNATLKLVLLSPEGKFLWEKTAFHYGAVVQSARRLLGALLAADPGACGCPGVTEACVKIRKSAEKHREWRPFAMAFEKQDIRKILYRTGVDPSRLGKAGTLIVNGFANEPYITSGYRLMMC